MQCRVRPEKRNHDPDDFSRKGEPSHVSRTAASPPDARGVCATAEADSLSPVAQLTPAATRSLRPALVASRNKARYRVLFATLLQGAEDLEEGLVDEKSPFAGTREFGLCFVPSENKMATVGVRMRIKEHESMAEGRMNISCVGIDRFVVKEVLQQKPFMICKIERYADSDAGEPGEDLSTLAEETRDLTRNVLLLTAKLRKVNQFGEPPELPEELEELGAEELSFWIAGLFDVPLEQQALIEMGSTAARLERQKSVLSSTLSRLVAQSALASALSTDSPAGEVRTQGIDQSDAREVPRCANAQLY